MKELTPNDIDVLETLDWANHLSSHPLKWVTPLEIGGSDGSYHSYTLNKLAKLKNPLVQFKQRGHEDPPDGENGKKIWATRGSKVYRITPLGRLVIEAHRQRKKADHLL